MTDPILIPEIDAAARLHMSRDWLARQARAKLVPHVQLGNRRYYTESNIAEIIAAASSPVEIPVGPARRRRMRSRAA